MKRFLIPVFILCSWLLLVGVAAAQTPGVDEWPPQTALYNDARLLALATPFLIAIGIVVGMFQARRASRGEGGDALLGEFVRRHDSGVIIAHWMNAFGLIVGVVSGAILLRWADRPVVERPIFIIHYLGAALTIFAISNHLARQAVSGGTDLLPKNFGVIRDLIGELFEYAGLFGPEGAVLRIPWPKAIRQPIARYVKAFLGYKPSRTGKFLATEKTISYPIWAILIALVVVTGLIKVFRYVYEIPSDFIARVTTLHDLATAGIGLMLLIHLLPLLLIPANWPLLLSIFKTVVPRKYVEDRHPVWYKELQAKQNSPEPQTEEGDAAAAPQTADAATGD